MATGVVEEKPDADEEKPAADEDRNPPAANDSNDASALVAQAKSETVALPLASPHSMQGKSPPCKSEAASPAARVADRSLTSTAVPPNKGEGKSPPRPPCDVDGEDSGIEEMGTESVAMSSLLGYLSSYTSTMANIGRDTQRRSFIIIPYYVI